MIDFSLNKVTLFDLIVQLIPGAGLLIYSTRFLDYKVINFNLENDLYILFANLTLSYLLGNVCFNLGRWLAESKLALKKESRLNILLSKMISIQQSFFLTKRISAKSGILVEVLISSLKDGTFLKHFGNAADLRRQKKKRILPEEKISPLMIARTVIAEKDIFDLQLKQIQFSFSISLTGFLVIVVILEYLKFVTTIFLGNSEIHQAGLVIAILFFLDILRWNREKTVAEYVKTIYMCAINESTKLNIVSTSKS